MKARALIIDDSITLRMDLKEALEEADFATTLCATAASARDTLQRQAFEVVILGLHLSDSSGPEFFKELQSSESTKHLPVLLLWSPAEGNEKEVAKPEEFLGKDASRSQVVARARYHAQKRLAEGQEQFMVLSIDDSVTFREAVADVLRDAGYRVAFAASGEEGLQLASELKPDILLIDEQMPGMDGLELQRRVRADPSLRTLPCLFLTASPESETRARQAGADDFVAKTENISVILGKVSGLLQRSRRATPKPLTPAVGPKRVLIVDDSPTYLGEASEQLTDEGYEMLTAASGQDALAILATKSVDAILLDLVMPGLSGTETCRRIKAHPLWREIPLLVLSAQSESEALLESLNSGADDYVTKSADLRALKARLESQLRRRDSELENRAFREELLRRDREALELRAVRDLAQSQNTHIAVLEAKNAELRRSQDETLALTGEILSFSSSASKDLRAPLRSIEASTRSLLEDCPQDMGERCRDHLKNVSAAIVGMEQLIDGMLGLANAGAREMTLTDVDLSAMGEELAAEWTKQGELSGTKFKIQPGLHIWADKEILRLMMKNLLGTACKYSSKQSEPTVELFSNDGVFVVRNNGIDFSNKPFGAYQRLNGPQDNSGSGSGLATAQRMARRHGGRLWAEAQIGQGTSFHFSW